MGSHTNRDRTIRIEIQNEGTFSLKKGENVLSVLIDRDLFDTSHCAGRGTCGKCNVRFVQGAPLPMPADRRRFSPQELRDGWRLACMAKPPQDCVIELPKRRDEAFILDRTLLGGGGVLLGGSEVLLGGGTPLTELPIGEEAAAERRKTETIIVADLGTTTIVLLLIEKKTGGILDTYKEMNPQRKYGADVITRMEHALGGKNRELSDLVNEVLERAVSGWKAKGHVPEQIVLAGNTVMTHLLMKYDVTGLSRAPFAPVTTASVSFSAGGVQGKTVPGISAFVGGDIVAGMLVCRRLMQEEGIERALFIDLGTNGEMVLFTPEANFCTATAAGPAFEGGFGGRMYGADVIAAVAGLLKEKILDETGRMAEPYFTEGFVRKAAKLRQEDIRALQLAKAAVFAGVRILLEESGIAGAEVERIYLAGGFGYKLSVEAACDIGLIPTSFRQKTVAVGNTALAGAYLYGSMEHRSASDALPGEDRSPDPVAIMIQHTKSINLAEKKHFNDYYLQAMELREERDYS